MSIIAENVTRRGQRSDNLPSYVIHQDFDSNQAKITYDPKSLIDAAVDYCDRYMPDDVTREHTKRMHYAAHRMHKAKTQAEVEKWQKYYHQLRDLVVVGNRKLIYRAVRRRVTIANKADDMIGDCHIVLIQAVAAFNPWLGIRFSTYAYTCLVRALSRMSQRQSMDWLTRSLSLDALPDGEPMGRFQPEPSAQGQLHIDEFLRDDHPLLSPREKAIISRRFCMGDDPANQTLEKVGKVMGLSKERVRQVQATALNKLRIALLNAEPSPQ